MKMETNKNGVTRRKPTIVGGGNGSKIDFYQIGDKVLELKVQGFSITEITDYCNTELLTEEGQFVSRMAVERYIQKNLKNYKELDKRRTPSQINELNEMYDMLEYADGQLEIIEQATKELKDSAAWRRGVSNKRIDELIKKAKSNDFDAADCETLVEILTNFKKVPPYNNARDVVALVNSSEKTLARRQSLLANIIQWKDKVYTFTALQKIVTTLMTKVKQRDVGAYVDVQKEFNADPLIQECIKYIPKINSKLKDAPSILTK